MCKKAVYRIRILPQMINTTVKDRARVFERTQHDCPNLITMYRYRCNCGRRNKPPFTAALHGSDKLHAMAELTHWTEGRVGPGWVWILMRWQKPPPTSTGHYTMISPQSSPWPSHNKGAIRFRCVVTCRYESPSYLLTWSILTSVCRDRCNHSGRQETVESLVWCRDFQPTNFDFANCTLYQILR